MDTFAEYIKESSDEFEQFLAYQNKGKLKITKDLYYYKSLDPKSLPLWTISTKEADVQKKVDKDMKACAKNKSYKDRLEEIKVSKYPKGTYEYTMHTRKGPRGDQLQAITLPFGRFDYFVLDRWDVLKLFKEGVLKFD